MAEERRFTVKEFAALHGLARSTVSLWCRNGFLAGAYMEETPFGGVWFIPESTAARFESKPLRGRPRASKTAKNAF